MMPTSPKSLTRHVLGVLALALAVTLSGCGLWKKMQANKKNQEVEAQLADVQAQQANRFLPDLFTSANKALSDSQAAVEGKNFDEALGLGDSALSTIEQIRSRLPQAKAVIQQKKTDLIALQERMNATLAQIKAIAPEETALVERGAGIDQRVAQIQEAQVQVVEGDQGYDKMLQEAKAFLDEATASLAVLEKDNSQKLISRIEDAWKRAVNLDVLKYVPESQIVPEAIESAKALVEAASYRAVLTQFPPLERDIGAFEQRAREARARARIEQANRLIKLAEAEPGASLEKIDAAKKDADGAATQLQQGNFDAAYETADAALSTARGETRGLEDDIRRQIEQLEIRLEESLKYDTARIASEEYGEAVAARDRAKSLLEDILYEDAEATLETGAGAIEEAIGQARSVQLSLRIREDQDNLLEMEGKGAYQYVTAEYQAIQGLIEDASGQVGIGSFADAEKTLDEAEQKILGLEARLREVAQNRLAEAESAHGEAVSAGARERAAEMLAEADGSLEKARGGAATSDWKAAIQSSEEARTRAEAAAQEAYRLRTEELKPDAERELLRARQSGAPSYAAALYNQALDALDQSGKAFLNKDFRAALHKMEEAHEVAIQARMNQIENAKKATDSAIGALAQDYDSEAIASALVDLAEARDKMEAGDYAASRTLADSALEKANASEVRTWRARATQSIAELKAQVAKADAGRGATYAAAEFGETSNSLSQAEQLFAQESFQSAYEQAEAGRAQAERTFAKLADEAQLVRGEYDNLVNQLKSYVQDDFGNAFLAEATARIGAVDDAILRADLPRVFALYEEGKDAVGKQIVATKIHNLNTKREELVAKIGEVERGGLIQFVETTGGGLREQVAAVQYDPVLDRLKPELDYYQQGVRALAQVESELGRMQEVALNSIDLRVQKVRTDIDNAREIGARDLAQSVFNSAVDNYEKARDMVFLVRNKLEGSEAIDFIGIGNQLRAAEAQANQLNQTAIERRNALDYMRDIVLWTYDMTRFLDQWHPVEEVGYEMILTSAPTSRIDTYKVFQAGIAVADLRREAERLYDRVRLVVPPAAQGNLHQMALSSFSTFVKAADNFQRYGMYDRYPQRVRERHLAQAFTQLERLHVLNDALITQILRDVKAYNLEDFERDISDELSAFTAYLRRDKSAG
ncbi:MAG: hypothetical protein GHCLOJNM_00658 [bacterium]|nr:hypothetical protein [bacterium]